MSCTSLEASHLPQLRACFPEHLANVWRAWDVDGVVITVAIEQTAAPQRVFQRSSFLQAIVSCSVGYMQPASGPVQATYSMDLTALQSSVAKSYHGAVVAGRPCRETVRLGTVGEPPLKEVLTTTSKRMLRRTQALGRWTRNRPSRVGAELHTWAAVR